MLHTIREESRRGDMCVGVGRGGGGADRSSVTCLSCPSDAQVLCKSPGGRARYRPRERKRRSVINPEGAPRAVGGGGGSASCPKVTFAPGFSARFCGAGDAVLAKAFRLKKKKTVALRFFFFLTAANTVVTRLTMRREAGKKRLV